MFCLPKCSLVLTQSESDHLPFYYTAMEKNVTPSNYRLLPQVASTGCHVDEKVLQPKGQSSRQPQATIKVYEISGHTLLNG
jgi:hypothetical protein